MEYSDQELLEIVEVIDAMPSSVGDWDCNFIESILRKGKASFSGPQREQIMRMKREYLDG